MNWNLILVKRIFVFIAYFWTDCRNTRYLSRGIINSLAIARCLCFQVRRTHVHTSSYIHIKFRNNRTYRDEIWAVVRLRVDIFFISNRKLWLWSWWMKIPLPPLNFVVHCLRVQMHGLFAIWILRVRDWSLKRNEIKIKLKSCIHLLSSVIGIMTILL